MEHTPEQVFKPRLQAKRWEITYLHIHKFNTQILYNLNLALLRGCYQDLFVCCKIDSNPYPSEYMLSAFVFYIERRKKASCSYSFTKGYRYRPKSELVLYF
uniref:Uncharacterized protein n=2 Tax=Micrurus TaxID=8634 RepID=A0A2D4KVV0_9SAUR